MADIEAAIESELDNRPRLLPSDITSSAIASRRAEAASWIHGRVSGIFLPTEEEIVPVSKPGHGIRPVAVWDFPSRILYGALVLRLARAFAGFEQRRASWRAFLKKPVEARGDYIVASDLAACYDYVDHDLLAEELLIHSGDHTAVQALTSLLTETAKRRYGLPQQSWASDILADVFLSRLERALTRRGLRVADTATISDSRASRGLMPCVRSRSSLRRRGTQVSQLTTKKTFGGSAPITCRRSTKQMRSETSWPTKRRLI